jgi:Fe-S-cluster containining protein
MSDGVRQAEHALLEDLRRLYETTDSLQLGASCPTSTECCRFGITGREPYVTSIEALAIQRAVAASGGPLSKKRRALPLAGRTSAEERTCPLLAAGGRCSVYAWRPFGCRTFFCARATRSEPPKRKEERELVRRLTELAARHAPGGDKVRPLTQVLSEFAPRQRYSSVAWNSPISCPPTIGQPWVKPS